MAGTGEALFDRRCRLTIANPVENSFSGKSEVDVIEIDGARTNSNQIGMRIQFKIDKSIKKEPNTSQITVTNLSESRRKSLQKKGVKLTLEAGYRDTGMKRYFSGDVRTVDHLRKGADWDTEFKLGDGERAWKYARVNESFAPGTKAKDVLKKLASSLELDLGNLEQQMSWVTAVFDQGYSASGSAARAFDGVIKGLGKEWSIQDGELQILDPYQALELPIPEISPATGLIDSPEMGSPPTKGKPALIRIKSLLVPVKPGGKVKLVSARYSRGVYVRIHNVSFTGDTSGGDWYSEMNGTLL